MPSRVGASAVGEVRRCIAAYTGIVKAKVHVWTKKPNITGLQSTSSANDQIDSKDDLLVKAFSAMNYFIVLKLENN